MKGKTYKNQIINSGGIDDYLLVSEVVDGFRYAGRGAKHIIDDVKHPKFASSVRFPMGWIRRVIGKLEHACIKARRVDSIGHIRGADGGLPEKCILVLPAGGSF